MAFRRQKEYKVIFILILHRNTIQGNSGLPSPPTHGSNLYPDIQLPVTPLAFCKSRNIQVGFRIGMIEDSVTDPICSLICLSASSCLLIHKLTCWKLDHDCSAFQLGSSPHWEDSVKGKKILNSLLAVWVISTVWGFKSASSCVRRGGPTWRMPGRTSGTGRDGARCVFGSAWSVHLSGQTSTHSRPSHSGKVSHLCGFAGVP